MKNTVLGHQRGLRAPGGAASRAPGTQSSLAAPAPDHHLPYAHFRSRLYPLRSPLGLPASPGRGSFICPHGTASQRPCGPPTLTEPALSTLWPVFDACSYGDGENEFHTGPRSLRIGEGASPEGNGSMRGLAAEQGRSKHPQDPFLHQASKP